MNNEYSIDELISANIILTNKCNSKCQSCSYWKIDETVELNMEVVCDYFDLLKKYNVQSIVLTGGEPTMHSRFKEIARLAKEEYDFIVILSTNAIGLENTFGNICDYIDSYCISFDGYDRETYKRIRGVDNFEQILRSIKQIHQYNENIQIWLSCLIQNSNYLDLLKIYNAAQNSGADGMFFNVPELKGDCFGRSNQYTPNQDLLIQENNIPALRQMLKELIEIDRSNNFLCQPEEILEDFPTYFEIIQNKSKKPKERECYVPFNTVTLTEYQKIKPCFYIVDEFDYNIHEDPINREDMIEFREKFIKSNKECGNCDYCYQFKS